MPLPAGAAAEPAAGQGASQSGAEAQEWPVSAERRPAASWARARQPEAWAVTVEPQVLEEPFVALPVACRVAVADAIRPAVWRSETARDAPGVREPSPRERFRAGQAGLPGGDATLQVGRPKGLCHVVHAASPVCLDLAAPVHEADEGRAHPVEGPVPAPGARVSGPGRGVLPAAAMRNRALAASDGRAEAIPPAMLDRPARL